MKCWKNITIVLPGYDLREITEKIMELDIISLSVEDLKDIEKSEWFHYHDKPLELSGNTHSVSILIDGNLSSEKIIQDIKHKLNIEEIHVIKKKIINDKNWLLHSQSQFQGVKVSDKLKILPPWAKKLEESSPTTNIIINPGSGFGTGSHPTTKLCLDWIETNNLKNKSFLDYGSGSGILGIVAKLYGADHVVAAEVDTKAILNAIYNCNLNNIEIPFIDVNKIIIQEKFDILMANILSNTLIQLSSTFKTLTKKKLILCGILDKQVPSVINSYSDWIMLEKKKNLEGWNLLEGNL
tara:strand:- start:91 stop:978 length:888 start_codon:yes stop_codon:yes gene_type:complete